MKMKIIYVATLMMSSFVCAQAPEQRPPCEDALAMAPATADLVAVVDRIPAANCPDPSKLLGICRSLNDQRRVPIANTDRTQYEYEQKMKEAACVLPGEDQATVRRKVQTLWNNHQTNFGCTVAGFDLSNGNILKYSVRSRAFDFLNLSVETWNLNLNIVDPVDNKTVLDYLRSEIEANSNTSNEILPQLQEYYDFLKDAGAKHRSEL
jgi:hypothetical protein